MRAGPRLLGAVSVPPSPAVAAGAGTSGIPGSSSSARSMKSEKPSCWDRFLPLDLPPAFRSDFPALPDIGLRWLMPASFPVREGPSARFHPLLVPIASRTLTSHARNPYGQGRGLQASAPRRDGFRQFSAEPKQKNQQFPLCRYQPPERTPETPRFWVTGNSFILSKLKRYFPIQVGTFPAI